MHINDCDQKCSLRVKARTFEPPGQGMWWGHHIWRFDDPWHHWKGCCGFLPLEHIVETHCSANEPWWCLGERHTKRHVFVQIMQWFWTSFAHRCDHQGAKGFTFFSSQEWHGDRSRPLRVWANQKGCVGSESLWKGTLVLVYRNSHVYGMNIKCPNLSKT